MQLEESNKINVFDMIIIFMLSGLLAIIILFTTPQETLFQSIIVVVSIFLFSGTIFLFTMKKTATRLIMTYTKKQYFFYIHLGVLLLLPLLSWYYVDSISKSLLAYLLWYILPVALFVLPLLLNLKQHQLLFHIPAALIMGIGFDNRETYAVTAGLEKLGYNFNAIWVSTLLLLILSVQVQDFIEQFIFDLTLKKAVLVLGLLSLVILIVVPIGLLTEFLIWNPRWLGFDYFIGSFIGIFFTIALPEELITRGTMQHQLIHKYGKQVLKNWQNWIIIIAVSCVFGASHWNNTSPVFVWVYIGLATLAGIIYGIGFLKGGLLSAILVHTLVDWIWYLLFKA